MAGAKSLALPLLAGPLGCCQAVLHCCCAQGRPDTAVPSQMAGSALQYQDFPSGRFEVHTAAGTLTACLCLRGSLPPATFLDIDQHAQ